MTNGCSNNGNGIDRRTKLVSVYLSDIMIKRIEKISKITGLSKSRIVEQAFILGFDRLLSLYGITEDKLNNVK